jgi:hypothetical protein
MRESNLNIKKDHFIISRIKHKKRKALLKETED